MRFENKMYWNSNENLKTKDKNKRNVLNVISTNQWSTDWTTCFNIGNRIWNETLTIFIILFTLEKQATAFSRTCKITMNNRREGERERERNRKEEKEKKGRKARKVLEDANIQDLREHSSSMEEKKSKNTMRRGKKQSRNWENCNNSVNRMKCRWITACDRIKWICGCHMKWTKFQLNSRHSDYMYPSWIWSPFFLNTITFFHLKGN